jgi:hypothetical protein
MQWSNTIDRQGYEGPRHLLRDFKPALVASRGVLGGQKGNYMDRVMISFMVVPRRLRNIAIAVKRGGQVALLRSWPRAHHEPT